MKKIFTALVLLVTTLIVSAQVTPYVEGSVGYFKMSSATLSNFLYDPVNGNNLTSYNVSNKGDPGIDLGVEVGAGHLFGTGLRLGVSETYVSIKNLKTNGTFTSSSGTTVESNLDAGNMSVNLMMANAYYDFSIDNSSFTPYIGAGYGVYANNRMTGTGTAWSLMTGVNYSLTENVYVGLKGTYYSLSQLTINDGPGSNNVYGSTNAFSVNGVLGYKF